jgi:hypothetical protein
VSFRQPDVGSRPRSVIDVSLWAISNRAGIRLEILGKGRYGCCFLSPPPLDRSGPPVGVSRREPMPRWNDPARCTHARATAFERVAGGTVFLSERLVLSSKSALQKSRAARGLRRTLSRLPRLLPSRNFARQKPNLLGSELVSLREGAGRLPFVDRMAAYRQQCANFHHRQVALRQNGCRRLRRTHCSCMSHFSLKRMGGHPGGQAPPCGAKKHGLTRSSFPFERFSFVRE